MAKYYLTKDVAGTGEKYYYDKDSQSWRIEKVSFEYNTDIQAINFAVSTHNKQDGEMFLFKEKNREDDIVIARLVDKSKEDEVINKLKK